MEENEKKMGVVIWLKLFIDIIIMNYLIYYTISNYSFCC